MKKMLIVLSVLLLIPTASNACTYDNIQIKDGKTYGRWIPCNDERCADYQRHKKMIENQEVHVHDVSKDKQETQETPKGDTGKVYDKKTHKERNVDAINAENDAINRATGPVTIVDPNKKQDQKQDQEKPKKKVPIEKKVANGLKDFFGF